MQWAVGHPLFQLVICDFIAEKVELEYKLIKACLKFLFYVTMVWYGLHGVPIGAL